MNRLDQDSKEYTFWHNEEKIYRQLQASNILLTNKLVKTHTLIYTQIPS